MTYNRAVYNQFSYHDMKYIRYSKKQDNFHYIVHSKTMSIKICNWSSGWVCSCLKSRCIMEHWYSHYNGDITLDIFTAVEIEKMRHIFISNKVLYFTVNCLIINDNTERFIELHKFSHSVLSTFWCSHICNYPEELREIKKDT